MDNNNPSKGKLPSLRTFALDQENNTGAKKTATAAVAPVPETKVVEEPPQLTSIDKKIRNLSHDENKSEPKEVIKPEITKPVVTEQKIAERPIERKALKTTTPTPTPSTKITPPEKPLAPKENLPFVPTEKKPNLSLFQFIKKWLFGTPEVKKIDVSENKLPVKTTKEVKTETVVPKKDIPPTIIKVPVKEDAPHWEYETEDETSNKTIWTPNTETVFQLLEEPESYIRNVQVVPRTNFYSNQREIIVGNIQELDSHQEELLPEKKEIPTPPKEIPLPRAPEVVPIPEPTPEPEPEPVTETKNVPVEAPKTLPEITVEEIKPETKPEPMIIGLVEPITRVVETPSLPTPKNVEPIQVETTTLTKQPEKNPNLFLQTSTNTLSAIVAGLIFVIVLASGFGSQFFSKEGVEKATVSGNHPKALTSELDLVFQPLITKASLVDRINQENRNSDTKVNQFIFTIDEKKSDIIKPSNLLKYLEINSGANFEQSITYIYFGSVSQINPYIILKTSDQITAKGGMLDWEKHMENDLKQILKSQTDLSTNIESPDFIDGMIGGVDVRVLKNGSGENKIVYGFANGNTIIITNSNETFGELLELIQP